VRQVRAGPLLGDEVVRRAGHRRLHPLPALPQRHRLVQETGGFRGGGASEPCLHLQYQQQRRPPVQPGEGTGLGSGYPSRLLRSLHSSSCRLDLIYYLLVLVSRMQLSRSKQSFGIACLADQQLETSI
jgi:hypothetical protein